MAQILKWSWPGFIFQLCHLPVCVLYQVMSPFSKLQTFPKSNGHNNNLYFTGSLWGLSKIVGKSSAKYLKSIGRCDLESWEYFLVCSSFISVHLSILVDLTFSQGSGHPWPTVPPVTAVTVSKVLPQAGWAPISCPRSVVPLQDCLSRKHRGL